MTTVALTCMALYELLLSGDSYAILSALSSGSIAFFYALFVGRLIVVFSEGGYEPEGWSAPLHPAEVSATSADRIAPSQARTAVPFYRRHAPLLIAGGVFFGFVVGSEVLAGMRARQQIGDLLYLTGNHALMILLMALGVTGIYVAAEDLGGRARISPTIAILLNVALIGGLAFLGIRSFA